MTFEDIVSEVKAGKFKPVYVLMGEETYFVDKLYGLIMERAVPEEERDFSTCVFDGGNTSTNEVINAARSYPMGDRMLVVVKNADELRDIDELAHYLKNPQQNLQFRFQLYYMTKLYLNQDLHIQKYQQI